MRRLHLIVGLVALGAFLATGFYMEFGYNHLRDFDDSTRLLIRSSHIYLLFTALLNLVLGLYGTPAPSGWRAWLRRAGSALLLIAPLLCGLAWLREPWLTGLYRPYALPAVVGSFAGVICHLASSKQQRTLSSTQSHDSTAALESITPG
jgi:hypothetical protein